MKSLNSQAMLRGFSRRKITETALSTLIAEQLLERSQLIKQEPKAILDLGCGSGEFSYRLSKVYPKAKVIGVDLSEQRIRYARKNKPWFTKIKFEVADAAELPFADNSFDLVISNLMLYWLEDLAAAFAEIQRVLKPEGVLLFSTLGPDSLQELRASFAQIDNSPHVNIFLDMHEIGDAMLKAGLKDPVMDVDYHHLYYSNFNDLIQAIKLSSEGNYHNDRAKGLMGKQKWQQLINHYEAFRNKAQKLPATFEVIFGHALGTAKLSRANEHGEIHIPISKIGKKP